MVTALKTTHSLRIQLTTVVSAVRHRQEFAATGILIALLSYSTAISTETDGFSWALLSPRHARSRSRLMNPSASTSLEGWVAHKHYAQGRHISSIGKGPWPVSTFERGKQEALLAGQMEGSSPASHTRPIRSFHHLDHDLDLSGQRGS